MRQTTPNILDTVLTVAPAPDVSQETRGALLWLPVGRIYDNPFQPRANYDDVESLAESIWALRHELPGTLGLQQQPVARVVVFGADGDAAPVDRSLYSDPGAVRRLALSDKHAVELHFGHRRLRAWRLLRERDDAYAEFPVLLAFADDLGMWKHVVAENAQRKDISPLEEAESLRTAINRFGLTHAQAAEPFGFARTTVSNKLRLLELPDDIRQRLAAGKITERHARALLTLAPAPHCPGAERRPGPDPSHHAQPHQALAVAVRRVRTGRAHGALRHQRSTGKWPMNTRKTALISHRRAKDLPQFAGMRARSQFFSIWHKSPRNWVDPSRSVDITLSRSAKMAEKREAWKDLWPKA
jgi:ParB/RepB/Spo0J family partition protein